MFKHDAKGRDAAALAATQAVVAPAPVDGTRPDYLGTLTTRLETLRQPRPGQPLLWVQHLKDRTSRDLAGATLYRLIRTSVRTENTERNGGLPPLRSTIATGLGAALLGYDTGHIPLKVGNGLIEAAYDEGIVEDVFDRGHRVRITSDLFNFVATVVNGARRSVLAQYPLHPPTGVRTRRKRAMLTERPPEPPRVREAAERLQGTPWRINRAVLAVLNTPEGRLLVTKKSRPGLEREILLAEADQLASLDRFYMRVHLDFRGRVYQDGNLLTYTGGGDYARGLLEFADGERLDDDGIRWLAWHAAEMWGHARLETTFGDSTLRLHTNRERLHWREAEHPAQFLAALLALADADAGRPVHLPVRVDATCSGLQHLALVARDTELAPMVNLWGDDDNYDRNIRVLVEGRPAPDFYQRVADAAGFSRKETKAVIVPLLYGAGDKRKGTLSKALARARRGDDARVRRQDGRDVRTIRDTTTRLAPTAFKVLDWFRDVARAHNACPIEIRWSTPSGFEAVQDYRYVEKNSDRPDRRVRVPINGRTANLVKRFYTSALHKAKQEITFPSSIVHSLDASLLAEIVARATAIEHWAVAHDAFAVPANRMWELLRTNEAAMREIYSTDWFDVWVQAWRAAGIDVPDPPAHSKVLPREMLKGLRTLG